MTHPHDHPARAELQALDQRRADTLADALRPDAAPTGEATTAEQLAARDAEIARLESVCDDLQTAWLTASAERDAALAIIAGRTVPPTDAEMAQHDSRGGSWLIAPRHYQPVACRDISIAKHYALMALDGDDALAMTWWALDATGRPCAWPVVDGGPRG